MLTSTIPTDLADALGALEPLAEAEMAGLIELREDGLGFRHELARRAIEQSLPEIRRRLLNQRVVAALRARGRPDRGRLLHHAAEAGDVDTLLAEGPAAAREAARAGSHRQALAHFEAVVPHAARLDARECAALLDDYGWELYNAHQFRAAVEAAHEAERLYREVGELVPLALCLVRLSRHLFMAGATDAAEEAAQRAVVTLRRHRRRGRARPRHAVPRRDPGPEPARARRRELLERADALALRSRRPDLAALCLNYLAIARVEAGQPDGLQTMRNSIALAQAGGHHEATARGYTNLAELLLRLGRLDELERCVTEGLTFTRERGFWSHAYNLEVHRCLLLLRRGDWDGAEAGLRRLLEDVADPGMLYAYSAPWLGRVLARRGDPRRGDLLDAAWAQAQRQHQLLGLAYAGIARAEWAWLTGDVAAARQVADVLLPLTEHPGAAPFRAELLRYLARAGYVPPPRSRLGGADRLPRAPRRPPPTASACAATGRRRPRPGGARATRTRRRSSSARATRTPAPARCARWSGSAAVPAAAIVRERLRELGAPSRAARARPPAPTRPG